MNYTKIYNQLIERSRTRILESNVYFETHHVIPRCMGGPDSIENLVKLTPEEHLVAHLLLVKMYPHISKLVYAANFMTKRVKNNKDYGWLRRKLAATQKEDKTGRKRSIDSIKKQSNTIRQKYQNGYVSPLRGRILPEGHKQAIANGNKGKTVPVEHRSSLEGFIMRYGEDGIKKYLFTNLKKKTFTLDHYIQKHGIEKGTELYNARIEIQSTTRKGEQNSFYGKSHTSETRQKISKSNTGKNKKRTPEHNKKIGEANRGKSSKLIQCPYCEKIGGSSTMKQWHFENCKQNPAGPKTTRKQQPMITCPHCNKTGNGPRMKSDHFEYCKSKQQ